MRGALAFVWSLTFAAAACQQGQSAGGQDAAGGAAVGDADPVLGTVVENTDSADSGDSSGSSGSGAVASDGSGDSFREPSGESGARLPECAIGTSTPELMVPIVGDDAGVAPDLQVTSRLHGVVNDFGIGPPPGARVDGGFLRAIKWIEVEGDEGQVWTIVGVDLPSFGVGRGAVVDVAYFVRALGPVSKSETSLELRVGDRLVFFYGGASAAAQLPIPPDLHVQRGAMTCMSTGSCGVTTGFELEMGVGDMQPVVVDSGRSAYASGYELRNIVTSSLGNSRCADAGGGWTSFAVASTEPLVGTSAISCQDWAMQFSHDVLGILAEHSRCEVDADCELVTPSLECDDPGTRFEQCPMGVLVGEGAAVQAAVDGLAAEYCAADCVASPSCPVLEVACVSGWCTAREPPP